MKTQLQEGGWPDDMASGNADSASTAVIVWALHEQLKQEMLIGKMEEIASIQESIRRGLVG
jgi:acyl carrier protein